MLRTGCGGDTTTYAYDSLGRRVKRTLPGGQFETYSYDTNGNLKSKTDFNGKTTTYAYDNNNRLLTKTPDPSFAAVPVTYTYDAVGRRQTMTDASGSTSYVYDPGGRLTQKATPCGTLNYQYAIGGQLVRMQSNHANGALEQFSYDADGRLQQVQDGRSVFNTNYTYDPVGNLATVEYQNLITNATVVTTSYNYDPLNRLTQMGAKCGPSVAGCAPGAQLSSYSYTLGAVGNRTSVTELSGRTVSYGYDDLYRLTSETIAGATSNNGTIGYVYDKVGNRQQMSSTVAAIPAGMFNYDADDRLTTDIYDPNGNTISSGGIQNVYDFENHLIQHGAVTIVYDGDGNRVAETVGGVTTNYLVDTNNLTGYAQVVEELQNGAVTRVYAYGLERISETQKMNGTVATSFYGYDGHGSVRQLFSNSGAVTDTYDYDAFGNLIASTGTTPNNYLFAAEQFDPALGLYYNRARYLNTNTGRFWGMDLLEGISGDPLSLHKYIYAENDPVGKNDPSGYQTGTLVEEEEVQEVQMVENSQVIIQPAVAGGAQAAAETVVVVSELKVALINLVLYSLIIAPVVAAVLPTGTKDDKKEPPPNRGRLQVQGADIVGSTIISNNIKQHPDFVFSGNTLSWAWSQPVPLAASTALTKLSEFLQILSFDQNGRRKGAFVRASRFIIGAAAGGGIGPIIVPPFMGDDPRYPDARVDIEVQAGLAFVPE